MNDILNKLGGGTIASDGLASEVADAVLENPGQFQSLMEGLSDPDDLIRARTSHAVERIARSHPEWFADKLPFLTSLAETEQLPTVRWHLAMLFGDLATTETASRSFVPALFTYLRKQEGVFSKSWAIASLCIIAKKYPALRKQILPAIDELRDDDFITIRKKALRAIEAIVNDEIPVPAGWMKSQKLSQS